MTTRGIRQGIVQLADDGRTWVESGTVSGVASHDAWGYLLDVTLQPSGQPIQARPIYAGTGDARGAFWPIEVGDEVLVLCPRGNLNAAVALAGLTSSEAAPPSDWDNSQPQICHPAGMEFRTAAAAAVEAVLLAETYQQDAATWEAALHAFMTTVSSATSVSQVATAAATFLATCGGYKDSLAAAAYSAAAVRSE